MSSERGGRYVVISKKQTGTAERVRYNAAEGIALASGAQVRMHGAEEGIKFGVAEPIPPRTDPASNFTLAFSLDTSETTFVPLGVPSHAGEVENSFVCFSYTLGGAVLDSLSFWILNDEGGMVYAMEYLKEIVVESNRVPFIRQKRKQQMDFASWDSYNLLRSLSLAPPDYTKPGRYGLIWDGFSTEGLLDTAQLHGKTFTARIVGTKGGVSKKAEVRFGLEYDEVDWVDVQVSRTQKQVAATLRVDFKDGGARGFTLQRYRDPMDDPRMPAYLERYDWEKVPPDVVAAYGQPPYRTRNRSFTDLANLALAGIRYYWSRNANHAAAKSITVSGESYQVFVNAVNTTERAMDDVNLVYNTNGEWLRSEIQAPCKILFLPSAILYPGRP